MASSIKKEIWVADIASNLFLDNQFVRLSKNDDQYVDNKTVNLPQSGAVPNVQRNRSSYPATAVQRADTVTNYDLNEFTTDPTHIADIEETEVSYQKRMDVLSDHISQLDEEISDYVAYSWSPTATTSYVVTTGAPRAAGAAGATGTRKRCAKQQILDAKSIMDKQRVPKKGRVLLLTSDMYNDLLTDNEVVNAMTMGQAGLPEGAIGRLYGFDVYDRASVVRYTSQSGTPKDPKAANAAGDCAASLAWHPRFVRAALGETKVFDNVDRAEYYGSIFSALVRAGANPVYTNKRGVVAIIEAV